MDEIAAFAQRIGPAGAINGLSQAMLRLTVPGGAGSVSGDGSLGSQHGRSDNRRPVDYALREAFFARKDCDGPIAMGDWRTGEVKQAIVTRALQFRAKHPALFADGRYLPLRVDGPAADHVVAFAREHENRRAIVVVTRLAFALLGDVAQPVLPGRVLAGDTAASAARLGGPELHRHAVAPPRDDRRLDAGRRAARRAAGCPFGID